MARKTRGTSPLDAEIISSVTRPIPTKELISRLRAIADNLSSVDQNTATPSEYVRLANDLANTKLIHHKNKEVQAYACCAVSDVLRIFAPEAPYPAEVLAQIFRVFFRQFAFLWDENHPCYLQHCHILKRLVEVRSVALLPDLHNAPELVSLLFDTMYDVAAKGLLSRLEQLVSELLAETISEIDVVPKAVVKLIIQRITAASESKILSSSSNISNPAFVFSLAVCEANTEKMARHLAQLFSEMLEDSAKVTSHTDFDESAPFRALEKIHLVSVSIWSHIPDLLASVMGLISDELNSDSVDVRVLATKTIGRMLASCVEGKPKNSPIVFVNSHRTVWERWVMKCSDCSPVVRSTVLESLSQIFQNQTTSEISVELTKIAAKSLVDANEKVRLQGCNVLASLPLDVFTSKACNSTILSSLLALTREKHAEIRSTAITFLSRLYQFFTTLLIEGNIPDFGSLSTEEIASTQAQIENDIPNVILLLNYINDKTITATVDFAVFENILPLEDDSSKRVQRLCRLYQVLNERSKQAFAAMAQRQKKTMDVMIKFLDVIEENATYEFVDNENKENLQEVRKGRDSLARKADLIILWLSSSLPAGRNGPECLQLFFELSNMRYVYLVKSCINSQLDFDTVKASMKELISKLSDSKNLKIDGKARQSSSDMSFVMSILLYRSAPILFNKTNIDGLITIANSDESSLKESAESLLEIVSTVFPGVLKSHVTALSKIVSSGSDSGVAFTFLRIFYHFVRRFPEYYPAESSFDAAIQNLATKGDPFQARYAMKILNSSEHMELLVSRIIEDILPLDPENPKFATHLSAVAEAFVIDPLALSLHSASINRTIIEDVLRKNRLLLADLQKVKAKDWIDNSDILNHKILLEKILALRVIANRLKHIGLSESADVTTIAAAERPIKLLSKIIGNYGEIVKISSDPSQIQTPAAYRSRLQLEAGLQLLKLARFPGLNNFIDHEVLSTLSHLFQNDHREIRERILHSLEKRLGQGVISERFYPMLFFLGHEPVPEIRRNAETWIRSQHKRLVAQNNTVLERSSVRLIHALAHDERFLSYVNDKEVSLVDREVKALLYVLKYVSMYLGSLANEANVNLLYYMASRVKQYRDKASNDTDSSGSSSANVYLVAELFQLMTKEMADSKGWNLQTWPGKLNLPADIYLLIQNFQEAQECVSKIYISDEVQIGLRQFLKPQKKSNTLNVALKKSSTRKLPVARTPKKNVTKTKRPAPVLSPVSIRKSRRVTSKVNYGESGSDKSDSDEVDEPSSLLDYE